MKKFITPLIISLYSLASAAQPTDTIKAKVHNHFITLYASGAGSPAVIMEAGGASSHKTWVSVRLKVAKFTKVVVYDRPGYLNSDTCSNPRDALTIAKELKEALTKAGIQPPYVLAGWSMGRAFVRVFAGLYPKDVAGLVLVDPTPEESYARFDKEFPEQTAEDKNYMQEILASKTRIGEREEMRYFDSSMNQARISDKEHTTPTYLLIAAGKAAGGQDRDSSNPLNKIWIEELQKWAKNRPNLKFEIINNSGHHIARFQPDTVVHAIRDVVTQWQMKQLKQSASEYEKPVQLNDGIQTATLKEVGLDELLIQAMTDSITSGVYPNIHSVLILRNNKLVYEHYWPGNDEVRGKGFVGFVDHHRDSLHDLRSATKSVVATLVLIAHAQGKIQSLNQRVFDFFPEYSRYDTGMKRYITVQHLLNMSAGLEWNENISYMDPSNSETRMDTARQPVEFVLSRDLIDTPGKKFNYSGGCTQVLAAIIEKTTGLPVDAFAEKHLFQPIGIKEYNWVKRRDGIPITASGLRLRSRDMAKFGLLYLNNGKWNGKQIIPSHLVAQTLKSQIIIPYSDSVISYVGYSNQLWIIKQNMKGELVEYAQCQGNGGQLIQIDKKNNLVLVVTAGNYNERNLRKSSFDIFPDFIFPAVIKPVAPFKKPDQLNDGIQTATLKDVGVDEKIINAMTDSITSGNYTNVHSVLISRNNKLAYENYFPGDDYARGRGPVGIVNHHRDSLHDLRSVTKSIVSAAVMIAHAQGKIKSLQQRVFDFFPQYAKYDTGMKRQITIQHLLNMSSGLEWHGDDEHFMDSMKLTNPSAAIEFVLKQKMLDKPGRKFNYSDGSTQLLAVIFQKTTGLDIETFTTRYLFQPLGIRHFEWTKQSSGMISAWAGLRMRSRDLLKFGLLYLNNGKWNGKQIIPSYLVDESLNSQVSTPFSDSIGTVGYSNQFWVFTDNINGTIAHYARATGNGGQLIVIDRERKMVVITTAGNYYLVPRKSSYNLYYDFVYPAVVKTNRSHASTEIIKELTYKAFEAEFKNDTAAISRLMADDFISVYPHKTQNKHQELAGIYKNIEQMKKDDHIIDSLYLDEFKVQQYDNTAIATYYSVTKGKMKEKTFKNRRTRWYDVWVKRNGEWKWVSSQGTEVKQ